WFVAGQHGAGLVDLAHHHAWPDPLFAARQRQPSEQRVEQRGLAAPVGAAYRDALGPPDLDVDGSQGERAALDDGVGEAGDDIAGARRGGDGELEVPALPWLLHRLESLECLLGDPDLRRLLLGPVEAEVALRLVVVLRVLLLLPRALHRPLPLRTGTVFEPALPVPALRDRLL